MAHRTNAMVRSSWNIETSGRQLRCLSLVCLTYFTPIMLRYDRTSHLRKLLALSRYQSRSVRLLFFARDKAIAGAGRRNLQANETICGRTHILSAPCSPLLFPLLAYVGQVFRRYTFEDIDRRVSPSVAVAAATLPAGNYSYSLFGRGVHRTKTFPRDAKRGKARREKNGAKGMRAAVESIT